MHAIWNLLPKPLNGLCLNHQEIFVCPSFFLYKVKCTCSIMYGRNFYTSIGLIIVHKEFTILPSYCNYLSAWMPAQWCYLTKSIFIRIFCTTQYTVLYYTIYTCAVGCSGIVIPSAFSPSSVTKNIVKALMEKFQCIFDKCNTIIGTCSCAQLSCPRSIELRILSFFIWSNPTEWLVG